MRRDNSPEFLYSMNVSKLKSLNTQNGEQSERQYDKLAQEVARQQQSSISPQRLAELSRLRKDETPSSVIHKAGDLYIYNSELLKKNLRTLTSRERRPSEEHAYYNMVEMNNRDFTN